MQLLQGGSDKTPEIRYPIVQVIWTDAVSQDVWVEHKEVARLPARIMSVGYLLQDGEALVIAQNIDAANEQLSMTMTIPGGWVESVVVLVP